MARAAPRTAARPRPRRWSPARVHGAPRRRPTRPRPSTSAPGAACSQSDTSRASSISAASRTMHSSTSPFSARASERANISNAFATWRLCSRWPASRAFSSAIATRYDSPSSRRSRSSVSPRSPDIGLPTTSHPRTPCPAGSGATASRPSSSSSGLRKSSASSAESTRRGAEDTSMNVSAARRGNRVSHIAPSIGVSRQPEQARQLKSPTRGSSSQSDTTSHSRSAAVAFTVSSAICSGELGVGDGVCELEPGLRVSRPRAEGSRRAVHSRATPPRNRRAPPGGAGRSRRTARRRASTGRRRP